MEVEEAVKALHNEGSVPVTSFALTRNSSFGSLALAEEERDVFIPEAPLLTERRSSKTSWSYNNLARLQQSPGLSRQNSQSEMPTLL